MEQLLTRSPLPPLQVKAGSIFDNIIVTDDFATAEKFAQDTWGKTKDAEKAAFDKIKEDEKAVKDAEAAAKAAEEPPAGGADAAGLDGDDDDDEDYPEMGKDEL